MRKHKGNLFSFAAYGAAYCASLEAVDGAEFVAGGAVLFLLGDGGQVGDVVFGGHGDAAHPDAGEGGKLSNQRSAGEGGGVLP